MGLLDAGFEKVGWLEKDGGGEARAEACGEVEGSFGCYIPSNSILAQSPPTGKGGCLEAVRVEAPAFTGCAT